VEGQDVQEGEIVKTQADWHTSRRHSIFDNSSEGRRSVEMEFVKCEILSGREVHPV
jgi:hypothetical protein